MSAVITAGEVHRQYNEVMAAFRRMIPSPALRMAFSNQVDGYLRQYALGVMELALSACHTPRTYWRIYPSIWLPKAMRREGSGISFRKAASISLYCLWTSLAVIMVLIANTSFISLL